MAAIERPKSLTETVLVHLRERIVSGDLPLGSALSERQLAEDLQVSKTPVREALAQLRSEDLVRIMPQRGAYVFTLSAREVKAICEFRLAIETGALKLAMERNRQALAIDIAAIVDRMREARRSGDSRLYLALDTEFHAAFFRHCGNHYLRDSYDRYVGKIAALRTHLAVKPLHTQHSFDEHVAMSGILKDGDYGEMEDVLREHIARTRETYSEEVMDIAALDHIDKVG